MAAKTAAVVVVEVVHSHLKGGLLACYVLSCVGFPSVTGVVHLRDLRLGSMCLALGHDILD